MTMFNGKEMDGSQIEEYLSQFSVQDLIPDHLVVGIFTPNDEGHEEVHVVFACESVMEATVIKFSEPWLLFSALEKLTELANQVYPDYKR